MGNMLNIMSRKNCIITVKKVAPGSGADIFGMGMLNFVADAEVKETGERLENITISVPQGVVSGDKLFVGSKFPLIIAPNGDGTYTIAP